jgi:hypothetical protein
LEGTPSRSRFRIISADEEEEMDIEGIHVMVKAAWKWMTEE